MEIIFIDRIWVNWKMISSGVVPHASILDARLASVPACGWFHHGRNG
jgi:hypothetical protein